MSKISKVTVHGVEYEVSGSGGSSVTVDTSLSLSSDNPVTNSAITTAINTKQDTISDLNEIRSGAAAGATALQSIPAATNVTLGGVMIDYDPVTNTLNIKTSAS